MITLEKLKETLEKTGIPVVYGAFPEKDAPALPVICYLETESNNFYADGIVYYSQERAQVELYLKYRSFFVERKVEKALKDFAWEKSVDYSSAQRCYQIMYEIEVQNGKTGE